MNLQMANTVALIRNVQIANTSTKMMNKELIEVDIYIVVLLYCRRKAWQKAVSFFDVPVGDNAIFILLVCAL